MEATCRSVIRLNTRCRSMAEDSSDEKSNFSGTSIFCERSMIINQVMIAAVRNTMFSMSRNE